jgi:hypothetical protein
MTIEIHSEKLLQLLLKIQTGAAITIHELADYVPVEEQRDYVIAMLINALHYATHPELKLWRRRGYDDRGIGFVTEDMSRLKALIGRKPEIERTWLMGCLDELIEAVGTK